MRTIRLYRTLLQLAKRFPSRNRDGIVLEIKAGEAMAALYGTVGWHFVVCIVVRGGAHLCMREGASMHSVAVHG